MRYNATKIAPQGVQLLWARTTHIGCARIEYFVEEEKIRTIICNYGPGGNVHGSAVWLIGEPCSKCGKGACCDEEFDGLCVLAKNFGVVAVVDQTQKIGFVIAFIVLLTLK